MTKFDSRILSDPIRNRSEFWKKESDPDFRPYPTVRPDRIRHLGKIESQYCNLILIRWMVLE